MKRLLTLLYLVALKWRKNCKPIICVCKVNNRVGLILKKDLDKGSLKLWEQFDCGEREHDPGHICAPLGEIVEARPVFVFSDQDYEEFRNLVWGCYVEKAVFDVPFLPLEEVDDYESAHRYIYGS